MMKAKIIFLCGLIVSPMVAMAASEPTPKEWRRSAVERPRRIIFNNDGCDVFLIKEPTRDALLKARTIPLVGTQVDSLFYSTTQGFGVFTHATKKGQMFLLRHGRYAEGAINDNQLPALIAAGIDPLQVMIDFSREQRMEVFCSFRMNDNHDGSTADYGPIRFEGNALKMKHPEYLLGSRGTRLPVGSWSSMNYGLPEVRELIFSYIEEVCRSYDLDGVELDFFRHPVFFKSTTQGEVATLEELSAMTGLMKRIRTMADEVGRSRGRPVLIAMRVPDSVDYARTIGMDLEQWLKDDLLDIMIVGGYFQLNAWDYSVALARKYGVKVYPSLDEPRVKDVPARTLRQAELAYLGRGAAAWQAGVDGMYMFNYFRDSKLNFELGGSVLRTIGDPDLLARVDKDYFGSAQGVGAASFGNFPLKAFQRSETLNPDAPLSIAPGGQASARVHLGADVVTGTTRFTLALRFATNTPTGAVEVRLNGRRMQFPERNGDWLEFPVERDEIRPGGNDVVVKGRPGELQPLKWMDVVFHARRLNFQGK